MNRPVASSTEEFAAAASAAAIDAPAPAPPVADGDGWRDQARGAMGRARDHLLSLQHHEGWWKGELETNVTMDAEDLLLREFLGIREPAATERSARWIRSQQNEDGSWSNFRGGP